MKDNYMATCCNLPEGNVINVNDCTDYIQDSTGGKLLECPPERPFVHGACDAFANEKNCDGAIAQVRMPRKVVVNYKI